MVKSTLNAVIVVLSMVTLAVTIIISTAVYHEEVPLRDCPQQKYWTTHRSVQNGIVYCFLVEDSYPRRAKYMGIAHVYH
jgi:hypothetical protein